MDDLSFSEMLDMQKELWEQNKSTWSPLEPKYARNSLLWMMAEIGEVIDIIKKCDETAIMLNDDIKESFVEELCDVLMYYNDVLLRYNISAKDISLAYTKKHDKNMKRKFEVEEKIFTEQLIDKKK